MTEGARVMRDKGREWEQQRKGRKARAAAQKAARAALAYPDAPNGLTPEARDAYHRQLKSDCLRRMGKTA